MGRFCAKSLIDDQNPTKHVKTSSPIRLRNLYAYDMLDYMSKESSLADRFRRFRESQQWSLSDLQNTLGIHRQTWSKWERGKQTPAAAPIVLLLALEWAQRDSRVQDFEVYINANSNWPKVGG